MSSVQFSAGFDADSEPGYPVVESAPLHPLRRRLLRRTQRPIQELPELVGGSVRVFQSNERYSLEPTGGRMLSSDVVLDATMVAVVSIKEHLIPMVATLPSLQSGREVSVRASYSCKVIDAVRVLEEGCWDVRPRLVAYLLRDNNVQILGARVDISDNPEVQQRILARMLARKALEPPEIPGMEVQLVGVSLGLHAEDGWRAPLNGGAGHPGAETDHGHDRYDGRGHDDQDDSYPPDGDRR